MFVFSVMMILTFVGIIDSYLQANNNLVKRRISRLCTNICLFFRPLCGIPVTCSICYNDDAELLPAVRNDKEKRFTKYVCTHVFCQSCLHAWIAARLDAHHRLILCPHNSCQAVMYGDDITRLAPDLSKTYQNLLGIDYKVRLQDLDLSLRELIECGEVQICPACGILINRESGCLQMLCTCGQKFCFNCGNEKCSCYNTTHRNGGHVCTQLPFQIPHRHTSLHPDGLDDLHRARRRNAIIAEDTGRSYATYN